METKQMPQMFTGELRTSITAELSKYTATPEEALVAVERGVNGFIDAWSKNLGAKVGSYIAERARAFAEKH